MSLTKAQIVDKVNQELNISKKEASDLVETVFEVIKESLSKGEKVKISGFGNFLVKDKASRKGRNPQTGEEMTIEARRVLTFRPSQLLKEDISEMYSHRINESGEENESLAPKPSKKRSLNSFKNNLEDSDDFDQSQDEDFEGDDEHS
jgi:integration host factor subunit alpha